MDDETKRARKAFQERSTGHGWGRYWAKEKRPVDGGGPFAGRLVGLAGSGFRAV